MVAAASMPGSPSSNSALADLCDAYWYPLYSFVRRKGYDRAEAEDLTQAFFLEIMEKQQIGVADEQRGKFRTFLLAAFDHFINKQWRSQQALKRGGGESPLSFDFQNADQQYSNEPFHQWTPQRVFDRNWALAVLSKTLSSVQQQYTDSHKADLFDQLKTFLGDGRKVPYASIAKTLDTTEGAIKVAVHRLRIRYGEQLRMQIARTVESPQDVDQELQALMDALKTGD